MATDIQIPEVGESITEGVLVRWLIEDGDSVREGDPLFELETDKASTEIPAPAEGVVQIQVEEGETVEVGQVVGSVEAKKNGKKKSDGEDRKQKEKPDDGRQDRDKGDEQKKREKETAAAKKDRGEQPKRKEGKESDGLPVSPAARRLIEQEEIDAEDIDGSGRRGLITKQDVVNFIEEHEGKEKVTKGEEKEEKLDEMEPPPASMQEESRERMSPIRQRIASRLLRSQRETASLTTMNEADMAAVMDWRGRHRKIFQEKHDIDLGLMSFFVKASVQALQSYPIVNARIEEKDIVDPGRINIGVAVSTEQGLIVPILRDADRMSFAEIESTIASIVDRARNGRINVKDLQGGTFTITNGGVFGSLLSTPILNPPQSAILGMHTVQKRPVVRDDEMVIRPMMYLALTYDHRLIDGRDAVLFLRCIKDCIEEPERMLLGV